MIYPFDYPFDYSVYDPYFPRADLPLDRPDYLSESEAAAIERVARQMSLRPDEEFDALPEQERQGYRCQAEMAFCTAGMMELLRYLRQENSHVPQVANLPVFLEQMDIRRGVFPFFVAMMDRWPDDTRALAASRLSYCRY